MVKKSLSIFLCIIMIFSCFGILAPQVYAANSAKGLFSVKSEPITAGKIVYTISLTQGQKNVGGFILNVNFDSSVLKPTNGCAPLKKTSQTEGAVVARKKLYAKLIFQFFDLL